MLNYFQIFDSIIYFILTKSNNLSISKHGKHFIFKNEVDII